MLSLGAFEWFPAQLLLSSSKQSFVFGSKAMKMKLKTKCPSLQIQNSIKKNPNSHRKCKLYDLRTFRVIRFFLGFYFNSSTLDSNRLTHCNRNNNNIHDSLTHRTREQRRDTFYLWSFYFKGANAAQPSAR